jgi:hypothetical protein
VVSWQLQWAVAVGSWREVDDVDDVESVTGGQWSVRSGQLANRQFKETLI